MATHFAKRLTNFLAHWLKRKRKPFYPVITKYANAKLIFPAPSLGPLEPPHTSKKVALAELVIISTGYHSHLRPCGERIYQREGRFTVGGKLLQTQSSLLPASSTFGSADAKLIQWFLCLPAQQQPGTP